MIRRIVPEIEILASDLCGFQERPHARSSLAQSNQCGITLTMANANHAHLEVAMSHDAAGKTFSAQFAELLARHLESGRLKARDAHHA